MMRTNLSLASYILFFIFLSVIPLFPVGIFISCTFDIILTYKFLIPLFFLAFFLIYIAVFLLEATVVFRLLKRGIKEGVFDLDKISKPVISWGLSYMLLRVCKKLLDLIMLPDEISRELCLRLAGADIGRNCILAGDISDPLLITIGDNSVIGGNSMILCHSIEGNRLFLKKTFIGKNVTIGGGSIVSAGSIIEDDVIVGSLSFVKKNQRLKKGKVYVGIPAKELK